MSTVKPYITTFTGRHINPLNPRLEDIHIKDIAHSLALVPRFAGHTQKPISIAQHSVYVSRLVSPQAQLFGLLHDASEAYLGDVTKWLKMSPEFAFYRDAETRVMATILRSFNVKLTDRIMQEVEWADKLMVIFEAEQLLPGHQFPDSYRPTTREDRERIGDWEPWTAETSETIFNLRFNLLAGHLPYQRRVA